MRGHNLAYEVAEGDDAEDAIDVVNNGKPVRLRIELVTLEKGTACSNRREEAPRVLLGGTR